MFTAVEIDYILSLINTYKRLGYDYYLCNTVTENNVVYDIDIYFSKKEIKAVTSSTFDLSNAIYIRIDSSNRVDSGYNQSLNTRDIVSNDNLSGIVNVDQAEFIYTNATPSDGTTLVNPDLLLNSSYSVDSFELSGLSVFMLCSIFLFLFFSVIFRFNK